MSEEDIVAGLYSQRVIRCKRISITVSETFEQYRQIHIFLHLIVYNYLQ